ncbi:MAG: D-alanyl-D-alanine carboxypeptidase family protein [Patescibacteria group bacterium]
MKERAYFIVWILVVVILGTLLWFNYTKGNRLAQELATTKTEFASSTARFEGEVAKLNDELAQARDENKSLNNDLEAEVERNDGFDKQIKGLAGTIGKLDKLSKTDKELLQKYSKVYFLNEHYVPEKLIEIDPLYVSSTEEKEQIHAKVWPFLERLLKRAKRDEQELKIISAFRSFSEQTSLKASYKFTYGAGTANQFSADQGYSEHQLGTTIDFSTTALGNAFEGIDKTEAYKWLKDNAYKYGFTLSYPENNVYYKFEPWHWRFVGEELATKLHDAGKYFYDLDQRELDTYLLVIFD